MSSDTSTPGPAARLTLDDFAECVDHLVQRLEALPDERWSAPAGTLRWTVAQTVDHLVDGYAWLAMQAVEPRFGRVRADIVVHEGVSTDDRLAAVAAARELFIMVLAHTPADRKIWHPHGTTDASGILAMGVAESTLHGYDMGVVDLNARPPALAHGVVDRLLPDSPRDAGPWQGLLWSTGRLSLPGRDDVTSWQWDPAPR
ncbi:MAG: DinB family protein [Micromonosporaceae bacterium]